MAGVFVTGGSGFIGGRVVERLVREGHAVRALARSTTAAERLASLGAEPVRGDITARDSLAGAPAGCELAFHAAAKVESSGPLEEFVRANVDGTRNVVAACAAAGVRRLVHVSSEAAVTAGEPLVRIDETVPRRPDSPAPYAATKAMAEAEALAANRAGFEVVVVRPRFVWGAGDTTLLPAIVALAQRGRLAWIGGGRHLTDVTHVDNVVEGLVLAAERGQPGGVYFVTDGEPVVFQDFVSELLRTQAVEPPDRSLPAPVAGVAAAAVEALWRLLPLPGSPPLDRFSFWSAANECTLDISRARRELGYLPIRSREQGMEELRAAAAGPG